VVVGIIDIPAARVLVDLVEDLLVVGIGMDRRHQPALDADRVVEHLGEGRQAIGGAAGVGDDDVILGQLVVIDAKHHGQIDFLARSRYQHPLGAGIKVLLAARTVGEKAGAFERDVDAIGLVRQIGGVALGSHMDALAIDDQVIAIDFDRTRERPMHRIALEQQGVCLGIGQIVDRNQFQPAIGPLDDGARDIAADAPETVDCNLGRHDENSS
jgi:hypothetical protein